jgi:hypothetical protein
VFNLKIYAGNGHLWQSGCIICPLVVESGIKWVEKPVGTGDFLYWWGEIRTHVLG